jgi:hypothetical protein
MALQLGIQRSPQILRAVLIEWSSPVLEPNHPALDTQADGLDGTPMPFDLARHAQDRRSVLQISSSCSFYQAIRQGMKLNVT